MSLYIPVNPAKCAGAGHDVSCQFSLYGSNTPLETAQKLLPNDDITGQGVRCCFLPTHSPWHSLLTFYSYQTVRAFLYTSVIALAFSFLLIVDTVKFHKIHHKKSPEQRNESKHYLRLIHTIESVLQTLSDQQLVAGIALLVALNVQACEVSAYHYNVACTMLLLSAITHLNTMINISDFLFRGTWVGLQRLLSIAAQLIFTGIVLSARNTHTFPSKPSALSIMPAACFENMEAMSSLGLGDFIDLAQNVTTAQGPNGTFNATQIENNVLAATSKTSGLAEYLTLVVFVIVALLFLVAEYFEAKFKPTRFLHWLSIGMSTLSLFASVAITVVAMRTYSDLRTGMEVDEWFVVEEKKKWTFSQLMPMLMLGSGSIALLKAATGKCTSYKFNEDLLTRWSESFAGHKGRRYAQVAQNAVTNVTTAQAQYNRVENGYNNTQENMQFFTKQY